MSSFSASSWPGGFKTHQAVSEWRHQAYLDGVRNGDFEPLVFQYYWYGIGLLLLHMLVPAYQNLALRLLTFAVVFTYDMWAILRVRAANPAASMALGILSGWNILWSAELLIFKDAKRQYKRVQRLNKTDLSINGNGHAHANGNGTVKANGDSKAPNGAATTTVEQYGWQSFPIDNFLQRLSWSADLLTSFRGINWNWKISGLPSRPPAVESSLQQIDIAEAIEQDKSTSNTGRKRPNTAMDVIVHHLYVFGLTYLMLDILKTVMNRDPYFWGVLDAPAPAYLPDFIRDSETYTNAYRLFFGFCYMQGGLGIAFATIPLVFVGFLGTRIAGISAEPWMYPDQFGTGVAILDRGLAGYWGGWWHQIFRHGFQAGGQFLTQNVLRLKKGHPLGALIELSTSFNLSGLMHVAISMTLIGPSNPWSDMFFFFLIQPIGILGGIIWVQILKVTGVRKLIPRWLGWAGNVAYVFFWFYLTTRPLVEELAKGGIFLYEPVPYSPLRALGLGAPGDGWECWNGVYMTWYSHKNWWQSGFTL